MTRAVRFRCRTAVSDWMTDEAREALFVSTLHTAALAAGIPID